MELFLATPVKVPLEFSLLLFIVDMLCLMMHFSAVFTTFFPELCSFDTEETGFLASHGLGFLGLR